jgi:hypothetical protein
LAERFFANKRRIISYFGLSIVCWTLAIYATFYFFKRSLF